MQLIPVVHDVRKSFLFVRLVHVINFGEIIFAFDEGERLLFVYRTRNSNRSVCHAISRFGRHLGPAWHTLSRSHMRCVQFFSPGSWYLFCDTRSQMKRWRFSVYHRFVYSFSRSFQLTFFIIGKFPF